MELKLGDFGLAAKLEFDGERKRTICGTPNYIAPEILEGKNGHSYEVDIWSLGVIIYALLIGKPPYETPDVKTTYKKIKANSYSFPEHVPISDAAKSLIQKILVLDPAARPSLDEIMEHPFLNNGGTIPKLLPLSTLACPPSASYIRQFQAQGNTFKLAPNPKRLGDTVPPEQMTQTLQKENKPGFVSTERVSMSKQTGNDLGPNPMKQEDPFNPGVTSNNFNPPPVGTKDFRPSTTQSGGQMLGSPKMGTMQFGSTQKMPTAPPQPMPPMSMSSTGQKPSYKNEIYVTKWVDYSSKYGLGYLLSNGSTGVYFNDSTKIILEPNGTYFEYIERRQTDKQDIVVSHTLTDYPKDLQKKVTLLQHFKIYLENDANQEKPTPSEGGNKAEPLVYVKKWMKTKHAIMFRLSNKIVQVDFKDKTEIILSSESKTVTYVNKKNERSHYPLATALESTNQEMTKRLKYTKEILTQMLNANQQPNGQPQPGGGALQSPLND
jgi:polo-like kinase 1